jgi:hypothetical protein
MAETSIELRTLRQGTIWSGVLTLDAPGLKAPLDFYAEGDVKETLGTFRALFGMRTDAAAAASATTRANVVAALLQKARFFIEKNPKYLGASSAWAIDALAALDKSRQILSTARGGNAESVKTIAAIYAKATAGDRDSVRSARMISESARLSDGGRASFRAQVADASNANATSGLSTGHDIGTRRDLRLIAQRISGFAADAADRHQLPLPGTERAERVDRMTRSEPLHVASGGDPFSHMPYPMDREGDNVFSNFQPALAAY